MSNFNPVEKFIAYVLSFTPGMKKYIKWMYQFANYILKRKSYMYKCKYPLNRVNNSVSESFFGYYDKSPENESGYFSIFQEAEHSTKKRPNYKHSVNIMLKNNNSGEIVKVGTSDAYNWQQGTKLQWLNNDSFVYNYFDKTKNVYNAKIYNIRYNTFEKVCMPVYDVFEDKYALSLNFSRLNKLRPDYGYRCKDEKVDFANNSNDGIFFIDFKENKISLLISLEQLVSIKPEKTMQKAKHKVNHIMISPNGDKFIFMHRWLSGSGKRYDRLLVSDIKGKNIKIIADDEMVSHCCWYNNDIIVGYLNHSSYGAAFYKIDLRANEPHLLSEKLLKFGDGHPTFFGAKMVFDSYPDRARMKHLYLYDIEKDSVEEVGEFFESLTYFGETRCDLHPKWTKYGKSIYFDSVHEGQRKLFKIQLKTDR